MSLLWINGYLIDKSDATISPFDHGFLYGDGVWEPLRLFGGKLFRPEDHFYHLRNAAAALGIDIPLSQARLIEAIEATVRANDRTEGYVRVIVTRGPGTLGPDPRKIDPQIIIFAEEYRPFPLEVYDHGLHVATAPTRVDWSSPGVRTRVLGSPHLVLAKQHALQSGCLEAVLLTPADDLVATTEGSLFLVKDGIVRPLPSYPPDVAWNAVVDLSRESGPKTPVRGARLTDLLAADEAFIAGTSCGLIGIVRVDEQVIGAGAEGPITKQLRGRYRVLTRGVG